MGHHKQLTQTTRHAVEQRHAHEKKTMAWPNPWPRPAELAVLRPRLSGGTSLRERPRLTPRDATTTKGEAPARVCGHAQLGEALEHVLLRAARRHGPHVGHGLAGHL